MHTYRCWLKSSNAFVLNRDDMLEYVKAEDIVTDGEIKVITYIFHLYGIQYLYM